MDQTAIEIQRHMVFLDGVFRVFIACIIGGFFVLFVKK